MTTEQQLEVQRQKSIYSNNVSEYSRFGSDSLCFFKVYKSNNENDKNITLCIATIDGLSDTNQPYTVMNYIMVRPDGKSFNALDTYPYESFMKYTDELEQIKEI